MSALGTFSPRPFENFVQALCTKILGSGLVVFGPGPDGGREATFTGKVPFPSIAENWNGYIVVQAKCRELPLIVRGWERFDDEILSHAFNRNCELRGLLPFIASAKFRTPDILGRLNGNAFAERNGDSPSVKAGVAALRIESGTCGAEEITTLVDSLLSNADCVVVENVFAGVSPGSLREVLRNTLTIRASEMCSPLFEPLVDLVQDQIDATLSELGERSIRIALELPSGPASISGLN